MPNRPNLEITRVRHPLKFRLLQVKRVHAVTPHLVRITLTGDDLHDFASDSFDDHVKVFFPEPGAQRPIMPTAGPQGPVFPDDQPRQVARDYTPRRYDRDSGELDIEFALHGVGPAATWAAQAQIGQYLGVGGPRGSMVIPQAYDWHLLIGDETALPAISRRLEELPAGTRVAAVLEVASPEARIDFDTVADLFVVWRYRSESSESSERSESEHDSSSLLDAVRGTYLPDGEGYVWAAGESASIRAVRHHLCTERGVDKARIRAASYWKQGAQAVHETLDD
ncbi:siderophore-interacting protein [Burkholderia sp. L27(2015)]|uniref:siderophore-interacting protein n=1 Tax=Burkholderia sp. L27(2015) TaxID=1641858 RepID=UPI00131C1A50|nr:siderophore-interacting protein [Burkholderia sp. L27(2015)]